MSGAKARVAATAGHLQPVSRTQPILSFLTPPGVRPASIDIEALHKQCVSDGIKMVRMCFLANGMNLLTYLVPTEVFFTRHAYKGRGLVPALNTLYLGSNDPAYEIFGEGIVDLDKELDFTPDWNTFRYLEYAEGHAFVLGDTVDRVTDKPWDFDARNVLRRLNDELLTKYNLRMICGTESEFYLYTSLLPNGIPDKLDETIYGSSQSLHGVQGKAFDEMILMNQRMGIGIYDAHSEIGPGQFEIATDPKPAEECAFDLMMTREIIHAVARQHGLLATFAPKPIPGEVGTGCHVHISLADASTGRNMFPDPNQPHGISKIARSFMAGIQEHARALCMIGLPTVGSYLRAQPGMLASAFTAWGNENREACLRVATGRGAPTNVEWRFNDACSHPYAMLAGLLAAGLDGIEKGMELPPPTTSPELSSLSPEELAARKVFRAPSTLNEAIDFFEKDGALNAKLGRFARGITLMRKQESKVWGEYSVDKLNAEMVKRF